MTQITLNIPDEELGFFMKLIEKFNYVPEIKEFEISEEMKQILDFRRESAKEEDFISWEEVKHHLNFKNQK